MEEIVALSAMLRQRHQHPPRTLDDIPALTRTLPQVHAASTRLLSARVAATADPSSPPTVHPAALRLFASVGFEADRLRRAVADLHAAPTLTHLPPRPADPHRHPAWLAPRLRDDARLAVNAALRHAARAVATAELVTANARLCAKLAALHPPHAIRPVSSSVSAPTTPASPVSNPWPATPGPVLTPVAERPPAVAVAAGLDQRYVDAIRAIALHGDAPSAASHLHEVAAAIPDNPHFVESLAVIASVSRHTPGDALPTSDVAVWGARVVLEDQFAESIPGLPQKPRLAAPPAVVPPIKDYVRDLQRQGRLGTLPDRPAVGFANRSRGGPNLPLWPQVYFCMRVGSMAAALDVLCTADTAVFPEAQRVVHFVRLFLQGRDHAAEKFRRAMPTPSGASDTSEHGDRIPRTVPMTPGYLIAPSDYIALEKLYKDIAWTSSDPFMRASLVLLMRLELLSIYGAVSEVHGVLPSSASYAQHPAPNKHQKCSPAMPDADLSLLFGSVEHYLWFRLWLCRTPIESEACSLLSDFSFVTHEGIQGNILSCGSWHFDPEGTQPLLYAFVLVCAGLYEEAITYLTTHQYEELMHSGVHLAVVLYHLHWITDNDAFHTTLMRYVSLFSRLFPIEAALYLMTIRDCDVLQSLLRELIVSTGEYETLLGSVRDGERIPGGLENLLTSATVVLPSKFSEDRLNVLRADVAGEGASVAASRGEYAMASELFILAGKHADSVEMVMQSLAEVVDKQSSPKRALAVANARRSLASLQMTDDVCVPDVVRRSLEVLLKMSKVFEEFWTWRFGSAWEALRSTDVLPMATEDISRYQRDLLSTGEKYCFCIQRCAAELLKVGLIIAERALEMGCVDGQAANGVADNPSRPFATVTGQLRNPDRAEVKALCVFAGLMRIADEELNERVVHIEMQIT